MKRDLDLVRKLLETFEAMPPNGPFTSFVIQDGSVKASNIEIMEHVALMCRVGLVEGICEPEYNRMIIQRISWSGHDFLDAARNEDVWAKAKERVKDAGSFTFTLFLEVLKEEAKRRIGGFLAG